MKKIVIAIDGHSSCGKSTTAKLVAKEMGYAYIDTGAMYRAVTLYFLQNYVDFTNPKRFSKPWMISILPLSAMLKPSVTKLF